MAAFGEPPADLVREVTPRPGHADLVGALKTNTDDCRNVLERASARETAARVAATGVAREFLAELGVEVFSYVVSIGDVELCEDDALLAAPDYKPLDIEMSEVRCPDPATTEAMKKAIDAAREAGESLGGVFRVVATGLLPGLGGYATSSERLTSRIGAAVLSIPAIKGVEFGLGFEAARRPGSQVHDPIVADETGFTRAGNNAGGLEGGMTTGMPLIVTAAMKPIPTLMQPLATVNMDTLEAAQASRERSDVLRRARVRRGGRRGGGLRAGERLPGSVRLHEHDRHQGFHPGLQAAHPHDVAVGGSGLPAAVTLRAPRGEGASP